MACSIQNTGYTGLYIDSTSENLAEADTADMKKNSLLIAKSFDTIVYSKSQDKAVNVTSDSMYSEKLIYENKSSLTSHQFTKRDSSETLKTEMNRNISEMKAKDSLSKISFEAQNKKFKELQEDIEEDKNSMFSSDSTFVLSQSQEKQILLGSVDTLKDSIPNAEINSEQNQIKKTDSIFVDKQTEKNLKENNTKPKREENLTAENDSLKKQIERLKSQQNTQQKNDIIYIEREVPQEDTDRSNDKKVETSRKEIVKYKTKKSRERPQPIIVSVPQRQQTIYPEKKSQTEDTIGSVSKSDSIINVLLISQKDTINQLKDKLSMIESYQQMSDTVYKINEITIYKNKQIDSVNISAFYEIGKTIPSNKVFDDLKEIFQSQSIEKVMLSGYTDASGNQSINKALTYKRLEYIKEYVSNFIPISKIYVQNFGDTFASSEVISTERRVEIALYIKQKNEQIEIEE